MKLLILCESQMRTMIGKRINCSDINELSRNDQTTCDTWNSFEWSKGQTALMISVSNTLKMMISYNEWLQDTNVNIAWMVASRNSCLYTMELLVHMILKWWTNRTAQLQAWLYVEDAYFLSQHGKRFRFGLHCYCAWSGFAWFNLCSKNKQCVLHSYIQILINP